ncbi:Riboflavin transporter [Roseobacter fucihabitans]|uniref:Riboflavin transporter n=1 Tax=Roseobacter fucihabitans TaxID=1537242 RepID=A0ABZ2BWP6_9RHOB|nr:DMT family transporter [Roseobacter litoralis]MBC6966875.1 Riboflavin transporter [Roseobacter litoralis]
MTAPPQNHATLGILFVIAGVFAISINDMLIKQLSGGYPLHEIVFLRSAIGILFSLVMVRMEGGWRILKTRRPFLHLIRGLLIVIANMSFFLALAAIPLADATALFFAAPLFITLLSIPILGEKVGIMRMSAVLVGFAGVVIMQRPWADSGTLEATRVVLLLPVLAAFTYALNQIMTRKLGVESKASALSVYIQATFIVVSIGFYLVAGDGRFAQGTDNASLEFLLRAWVWPAPGDWGVIVGMGANAAIIGYCLSQAYRMADAATVAPFEYVGLPLAVFWGWLIFAELPVWEVWAGIFLILGSGLFVFLRERQKARVVARAPLKRH